MHPEGILQGFISSRRSWLNCEDLDQSDHADDRHHALHVVGEHIERHLGCYSRKPFHEKVRCSHPALDSAERMFCRLTTHCHLFWMMIETCLHSLKHGFVLPSASASRTSATWQAEDAYVCP